MTWTSQGKGPVFIVPSAEVHKHAIPHLHGDTWHFDFDASLAAGARDRWVPYRVNTLGLGKRILSVIAELEKKQAAPEDLAGTPKAAAALWVYKNAA